MLQIIPGILEKDWVEIKKKIEIILPFSKTVHIDLIDGKFVENVTFFDPTPFAKYTKDALFELHMMIEEPINYLKPWANAGFKRFIGHIEKMSNQIEFVAEGQLLGEVGLAIDGPSSVDMLEVPLEDLDVLLFMTVKAGASSQKFITEYLEKVKKIRARTNIPIEVDGGITDETVLLARQAGANRFVSTSFISKSISPQEQFKKLQQKLSKF